MAHRNLSSARPLLQKVRHHREPLRRGVLPTGGGSLTSDPEQGVIGLGLIGTAFPSGELHPRANLARHPSHTMEAGKAGRPCGLGSGCMDQIGNIARPIFLVAIHGLSQLPETLRIVTASAAFSPNNDAQLHPLVAAGVGKREGSRHLPTRNEPLPNRQAEGGRHSGTGRHEIKVH